MKIFPLTQTQNKRLLAFSISGYDVFKGNFLAKMQAMQQSTSTTTSSLNLCLGPEERPEAFDLRHACCGAQTLCSRDSHVLQGDYLAI